MPATRDSQRASAVPRALWEHDVALVMACLCTHAWRDHIVVGGTHACTYCDCLSFALPAPGDGALIVPAPSPGEEAPSSGSTAHIAYLAEETLSRLAVLQPLATLMPDEPPATSGNPFFNLDEPSTAQDQALLPCVLCGGSRLVPTASWTKGVGYRTVPCPACTAWPMPSGREAPPCEEG